MNGIVAMLKTKTRVCWLAVLSRSLVIVLVGVAVRCEGETLQWADRQTCYKSIDLFGYDSSAYNDLSRPHKGADFYHYHLIQHGLNTKWIFAPVFNDYFSFASYDKQSGVNNKQMTLRAKDLILPVACVVEYSYTLWHSDECRIDGTISRGEGDVLGAIFLPASVSWDAPVLLNDDQYNKYDCLFSDASRIEYGEQNEVEIDGKVYSIAEAKLVGDNRKMLMRPKELQIAYSRDADDYDVERKEGYYPVDKSRSKYLSFDTAIASAPEGVFRLPDSLPITGVGSEAFKSCSSITEVALPANIAFLDAEAFLDCENLQTVFCEGDCEIDANAFKGCAKLKNAYFLGGCRFEDLIVGSSFTGVASSMKYPEREGEQVTLKDGGTLSFASMTMTPIGNMKFTSAVKVSMTASHGFEIKYTLDGSEPSGDNGETYSSALRLSAPAVVKAASFLRGRQMTPTKVLRMYEEGQTIPTVEFTPAGGTHFSALTQKVELTASCADAEIFYTLDGSIPTDASLKYDAPILLSDSTTIKAVAYRANRTVEGEVREGTFVSDRVTTTAPPVISPVGVTSFDYSNFLVSMSCATEGATIYYTVNGRDPLVAGRVYTAPFHISETTIVRAVAIGEGLEASRKVKTEFVRIWNKVATPLVKPRDTVSFSGSKTVVSAECGTVGASLYYCVNAVPSEQNRVKYTGPIEITASSTVYFQAIKDDWVESDVASVKVEKIWQYGDGVGDPDRKFTAGGNAPWVRDDKVSHGGRESLRSGKLSDGEASWIETEIAAGGTVSFWWKTSCEDDQNESTADWDHLAFFTNGVEVCRIDGEPDWKEVSLYCGSAMTLRWEYSKDDSEFGGNDCGWIADFAYKGECTARFDANGGRVSISHALYKDGIVRELPIPVREGYLFVGWFLSKTGVDEVKEGDCLSHEAVLYAHWGIEKCVVSFDANGGSGTMDPQTFEFGETKPLAKCQFYKEGCHFAGWSLTPEGEMAYAGAQLATQVSWAFEDGPQVKLTSETGALTLYAKWELGVLYGNQGLGLGMANGRTWYVTEHSGAKTIVSCDPQANGEDLTIPAHIGNDAITRTWLSCGGQLDCSMGSINVLRISDGLETYWGFVLDARAQKVILPPSLTHLDRSMCFWQGDSDAPHCVAWTLSGAPLGVCKDAFGSLAHTRCVVAALGGVPEGIAQVAADSFIDNFYFWCNRRYYESWVSVFGQDGFLGYIDDGWGYDDTSCNYTDFIVDSAVVASEPFWKGLRYVPFVDDPHCQNRLFLGWYTAEQGGNRVRRGDAVTSIQKKLYARFAELDPMGGSIAAEYNWRDVLPVPVKTGYVFEGWYTASVGGTKVTSLEAFQGTSNCTLFAHWLPLTYSVILDGGDGFGSETISGVRYGEEIVPGSVKVAKPGSRIIGWSQTAGGALSYPAGAAVSNLTTVSGAEVRLFAMWGEAEIIVHSFQQRYPWNGLVDVDFTLNGDAVREYPLALEVMDDGMTNLSVRTILDEDMRAEGNPFVSEAGRHRVIWDAGADLQDGYKCGNVSARLCHAMVVEFDACGGECEDAQRLYVLSEPYNVLPMPTKVGCVFQGWYRDTGYEVKVTKESVVVPSVRTLYARWEVEK